MKTLSKLICVSTLLLISNAGINWCRPPTNSASTRAAQSAQSELLEARRLNQEMETLAGERRFVEAISRAERLLSILERVLGPEDVGVARLLNNLAGFYRQTGSYLQAESRYKRSLTIVQRKLGPDHSIAVLVLGNLAGLYILMGDYVRAEQFYKRTLDAAERGPGTTSVEAAQTLSGLGTLYSEKATTNKQNVCSAGR